MIGSFIPIIIFILITLIYFFVVYNSGENFVFDIVYLALILGTQFTFAFLASKSLCGTVQLPNVFLWGLTPWVFIFLSMYAILKVMPGWKSPFSNTFGYAIVNMLGIKNVFNSLMKSNFKTNNTELNKIAENIYEDHSILINELTPNNFDEAVKKLIPLFDTKNNGYNTNINALKKLVRLKDEISRFIWYSLSGILTISVTNMGIASSDCVKSAKQIKEEVAQFHKQMNTAHKETASSSKPTKYIIRD